MYQDCILASLSTQFPQLKVIGEEGDINIAEVNKELIINDVDSGALNISCPEKWKNTTLEDLTVWVDPLDGTKEYTEVSE